MGFYFEPFLALRYLRSKRREVFISIITVISILGVAVSVVVLDIVLAIMTGFEAELRSRLVNANEHIRIYQPGGNISEWEKLVDQISVIPGVKSAFGFTYNQVMVSAEGAATGVIIRGVSNTPAAKGKVQEVLESGNSVESLFSPQSVVVNRPDGVADEVQLPTVIVGRELKLKLGLHSDRPVTLLSPQFIASPQGLSPKMRRFAIGGVYASGLIEYESALAYMSLDNAQHFFGFGDAVGGIEVVVDDIARAPELAQLIAAQLNATERGLRVTDWTEVNRPLWQALELEKRVYFFVLLLLILVSSFSIVATLVMLVMEKSRDIAVLKTIGATSRSVLAIFLIEGTVIGVLGTILGSVLGYAGCIALKYYGFPLDQAVFGMDRVPVHLIPQNFVVVAVSAFLISSLAGVYPALRAARLKPAEALRFE